MAVSTTYVGGLCTNALPVTGGELQGDLTMLAGKTITPDKSTASATAGAATLSKQAGIITSEALTTAAAATYTLEITNTLVTTSSVVLVNIYNGTNTQGVPTLLTVKPTANTITIVVVNNHASEALNGTLKFSFLVC